MALKQAQAGQVGRAGTGIDTRAGVRPVEPVRTIFGSLAEAEAAFAELEQRWGALLDRLDAVMTPATVGESGKAGTPMPAVSAVASRLIGMTGRTTSMSQSMEDAISRIEV